MEQVKNVQPEVEAEFEEIQDTPVEGDGVEVRAELVIRMLSNGALDVSTPEGAPELQPADVEALTRQVYEQLRDLRIAQQAIEVFKARLG